MLGLGKVKDKPLGYVMVHGKKDLRLLRLPYQPRPIDLRRKANSKISTTPHALTCNSTVFAPVCDITNTTNSARVSPGSMQATEGHQGPEHHPLDLLCKEQSILFI